MTTAPPVSVVIPTYNRLDMAQAALASVFEQTHTDFELIVVDDGSTDGTLDRIEATFGTDPRLRTFRKDNGGSASARNLGVQHARGTYVAYLDSDDRWMPNHLESQLAFAAAHPEADLILCDARYDGGEHDGTTVFGRRRWRTPDSVDAMCRGAWALPSCMLVSSPVAKAVPWAPDFPFAEDTAFLFDFNDRGHHLAENPAVLTAYATHDGTVGEPQKVAAQDCIASDHIALLESFQQRTSGANRDLLRKRLYAWRRDLAKTLIEQSRWKEARPHLLAWWRHRKLRARPAWLYMRSFFAGGAA